MEDRAVEAVQRIVEPLGVDAVLAERLVLAADLLALLLVGGETQAAGPTERVAAEFIDPIERALSPVPERGRLLAPV